MRAPRSLGFLVFALLGLSGPAWGFPTTAFLTRYWHRPLPLAGKPVPPWPRFERTLSAQACARCHKAQYDAWHASRHALAMGPGVTGQLAVAGPSRWPFVRSCIFCHAPGDRQWRAVRAFIAHDDHLLTGLAHQGVTCADCHVRHYQRFGPGLVPYLAAGRVVHNGFTPESAFTRSRFCAGCHQFHKNGTRLHGLLLENTYNEWRASRYAKTKISCQSCHMPGGHHSFLGIHSRRFVRHALTIDLRLAPDRVGHRVHATLAVTNSGVGHDFPTYTTPTVVLSIAQLCGKTICAGSRRQTVIARRISLDLRHQYFDTRLAPGATRTLHYHLRRRPAATALLARIVVYPDAAYVRFFRAYLAAYTLTREEHAQIERALTRDERSRYILWSQRRPFS
ncbi:MAG TPA: multiheme c-type cytochrome [Acidiferrobacter sp.]|nr:multiheme c-type cytochrome [Acidiferrobacter sp.]